MNVIRLRRFINSIGQPPPAGQREQSEDQMEDDFVLISETDSERFGGSSQQGPELPPSYEMAMSMSEPPPSYFEFESETHLPPDYSSLPFLPSSSYEQNMLPHNSSYSRSFSTPGVSSHTTTLPSVLNSSTTPVNIHSSRICDAIPFQLSRTLLTRAGASGDIPVLSVLNLDEFQYDFSLERFFLRDTEGDQGIAHLVDIEGQESNAWNHISNHNHQNGTVDVLEFSGLG